MKPSQQLLPRVANSDDFNKLFKQDSVWRPAIDHLIEKHDLEGELSRATRGSHIVYRVGELWIKLMAPIYAQDLIYEIAGLESIPEDFPYATPKILLKGELESWPYVVMTHAPGTRVGDIYPSLNHSLKVNLAKQFGQAAKALHQVTPQPAVRGRVDWNTFIRHQYQAVVQHHSKYQLSDKWLANLEAFIRKFPLHEFECKAPVFLHSDLTFDHFLIEPTSDESFNLASIIDFADCRYGHPEYELAASAVFLFKAQAEELSHFIEQALGRLPEDLDRFSEKLMAWTILHQYSRLPTYFEKEMASMEMADFGKLAKRVFPLKAKDGQ